VGLHWLYAEESLDRLAVTEGRHGTLEEALELHHADAADHFRNKRVCDGQAFNARDADTKSRSQSPCGGIKCVISSHEASNGKIGALTVRRKDSTGGASAMENARIGAEDYRGTV
jgi:hypothetical protein